MHDISVSNRVNGQLVCKIDRYPEQCPMCHISIHPVYFMNFISGGIGSYTSVEMLCRCPRQDCGQSFLAIYKPNPKGSTNFIYDTSAPSIYQAPLIPDNVKAISQSFYNIYSQAHQAEMSGLTDICGAGYRKALEFLVKDFIISKSSEKKEAIIKTPLGSCIETYIEDATTKKMAKRATWLGNDETHYDRKWEGKDLADLKNLIRLTVNAIDNQILAEDYVADMEDNKT